MRKGGEISVGVMTGRGRRLGVTQGMKGGENRDNKKPNRNVYSSASSSASPAYQPEKTASECRYTRIEQLTRFLDIRGPWRQVVVEELSGQSRALVALF